ncbi:MAG: restriction endonuclease subunit S, partial [Bacteroidales bacterium]|nr:restriction endonuclease subunit S [Bacteroidales bacterium]
MKTMTAKDLKNALLQEAVQGRLVPQCAADGNARTLLDAIRTKKSELIKTSKLKKEKSLPEITLDEIPFDIPESWCWCRFENICAVLTCGYASTPTYVSSEVGMPFLSAKNVKPFRFLPEDHNYISKELYDILTKNTKPEKGDILLTRVGAGIGEAAIIDIDFDFAIYVSLTLIKLVDLNLIDNKYVLYWLSSPIGFSTAIRNIYGKDSSQGNLNVKNVREFCFPLPPLAEQHRIVSAIEKLLPLIDEYGKKELVIDALNSTIGQTAKKAILQEAVQGRLVPQCAADGNARELLDAIRAEKQKSAKSKSSKPLPPIADDEIPFDIPDNWVWVRLGEIVEIARGGSPRPIKDFLTNDKDGYNWIKIGDTEKDGKYINHTEEKIIKEGLSKTRLVHKGDFLLTNSMSFGRPYILNIDGCIHDGWLVLSNYQTIFDKD